MKARAANDACPPECPHRVREALPAGKAPGGFAHAFGAIFEKELVAAGLVDPQDLKGDPPA